MHASSRFLRHVDGGWHVAGASYLRAPSRAPVGGGGEVGSRSKARGIVVAGESGGSVTLYGDRALLQPPGRGSQRTMATAVVGSPNGRASPTTRWRSWRGLRLDGEPSQRTRRGTRAWTPAWTSSAASGISGVSTTAHSNHVTYFRAPHAAVTPWATMLAVDGEDHDAGDDEAARAARFRRERSRRRSRRDRVVRTSRYRRPW